MGIRIRGPPYTQNACAQAIHACRYSRSTIPTQTQPNMNDATANNKPAQVLKYHKHSGMKARLKRIQMDTQSFVKQDEKMMNQDDKCVYTAGVAKCYAYCFFVACASLIFWYQMAQVHQLHQEIIIKKEENDGDGIDVQKIMMIPQQPDPSPKTKILHSMNNTGDFFDSINCMPTSQVLMNTIETKENKWIMQALDEKGNKKAVGGDEFYVEFFSHAYSYTDKTYPQKSADHPLAVGKIKDMNDGTYEVEFISSPMAAFSTLPSALSSSGGKLVVHFVYTCGIGRIAPPLKHEWESGGFTQTSYTIDVDKAPPIQVFQLPERVIDLSKFDRVVFVGDSVMQQFVKCSGTDFNSRVFIWEGH
mmetsp:Transcript_3887/g.5937  ORF Transcript_3887/g.5937 Transcript_3887/m.5937 type:complete len:361 (+) Transcript_3887:48-1130(+)